MLVRTYQTTSEEETIAAGRDFATLVVRPAVVLLTGDLGAGKTTFAKGIANQLTGVPPEEVTSPTFTLIHEYAPDLLHLDLYRLEDRSDLASLGIEDLLFENNAVLIAEWGEPLRGLLPEATFDVRLAVTSENGRQIEIHRS